MENNRNRNNENKPKKRKNFGEDGFEHWGGYMAAKRAKLLDQFKDSEIPRLSNIFEGVAIHVNGLTRPPNDELKKLMAAHGGLFHMYQTSATTHIIASNLPNVKVKHLGSVPVVKPSWITESIEYGKLLDYRRYLLYTNQSKTQPRIDFPIISNEQVRGNRPPTKTASDPKFLEEFYSNSRLHLISTLGAEFKQLIGDMRDKSDGKFPGKEKLLLKAKKHPIYLPHPVIMHIDMDCFFVSVSLRDHPELQNRPVAVTHARNGQLTNIKPEQKANREQEFSLYADRLPAGVTSRVDRLDTKSSLSEIASCSYEARQCGIRNGMFLGQAVKLCPELKTLPYDFEGIKAVSRLLYETIASYTLDIEAVSCDEMFVDVTRLLKETGLSVDDWAAYIRSEITNITKCPCSTGFGANRLQARLATRRAKPSGQYYLRQEDVENYMTDVKLSDLPGVGRATLSKLERIGLRTCGDVQSADVGVIRREIGQKAGETLKEQSRGIDNRPLNFHHERKSVSAEVNYGIRFKTIDEFYAFLHNLSEEVYNRMNDVNMRARCLTLKLLIRAPEAPKETAKFLGHGVCDSLTKSSNSNAILNNPSVIFGEAKLLYEKLRPPFGDLRGVGLQLTKLERNCSINNALSEFLKGSRKPKEVQKKAKDEAVVRKDESKRNGSKKAKSGNPNAINDYFSKTKQSSGALKSCKIDVNVLNELPDDIRKEIIEEYNLQESVAIECKRNDGELTRNNGENNERFVENRFENLSWNEIKPIIKKWIESDEFPYDIDIEMIAEHFKRLAIDRKIETLPAIFNFLHRNFSSLNCAWHEAYYKMVNIAQEGMVARYGNTLLVKRRFPCCEM
ncbi:unnamed protein product [Phyllotreta striolata]|uniref:DNA repair protein REV1 n=1 Tax=Phyllotreta striolata TaxID=444603 RepID=A0A9N9XQ15_PHYSR|nr:unnamed protein product [Phyllotreta striolata]